MKHELKRIALGLCLSIIFTSALSEVANPFDSIIESAPPPSATDYAEEEATNLHPLLRYPVKKYVLMGTLVSNEVGIALVRSKSGEEFFVRVSDILGNADGRITSINSRGIEVTEEDKVVNLLVRNRSISNDEGK